LEAQSSRSGSFVDLRRGRSVRPYISFEQHGKIDSMMSGIVTTMPNMLFFANHPSAQFFRGQGVAMAATTGMSEFDALPSSRRQKRDLEEAA